MVQSDENVIMVDIVNCVTNTRLSYRLLMLNKYRSLHMEDCIAVVNIIVLKDDMSSPLRYCDVPEVTSAQSFTQHHEPSTSRSDTTLHPS